MESDLPLQHEQDRHVKISDLLSPGCVPQQGDYIDVSVVWLSETLKTTATLERNEFIFADDTGHIAAVIFFKGADLNAKNVCLKLKSKPQHRIRQLKVENSPFKRLRGQEKRLVLKNSTGHITSIDLVDSLFLPTCIPFQFTKLDDIDNHANKDIIDLIGFTCEISGPLRSKNGTNVEYKKVILSSARKNGFSKEIALFDCHKDSVKRKNAVYAFMNIEVDTFKDNKSLQTTTNTVILEISRDNIAKLLPSEYHTQEFVTKLFPKPKDSLGMGASRRVTRSSNGTNSSPETGEGVTPPEFNDVQLPRSALRNIGNGNASATFSDPGPSTSTGGRAASKRSWNHSTPQNSTPVVADVAPHRLKLENGDSTPGPLIIPQDNQDPVVDTAEVYDFKITKRPLKVRVMPATTFVNDGANDVYSMRSRPRGNALIIHNTHFPHKEDKNRKGGVHDARYLIDFLESCFFKVTVKHDVKSENVPNILQDFKNSFKTTDETGNVEALFVAVLSHGAYGVVEMVDGVYVNLHNTFVYPFDEEVFQEMKGKPKIFVVQTCQDFPLPQIAEQVKHVLPDTPQQNSGGLNNMIVCYPTSPGSPSLRDKWLGSHYIYVLVEVLMRNAHNTDFVTMLGIIQEQLKKVDHERKDLLSCTWTQYSFKKLYFNPKY